MTQSRPKVSVITISYNQEDYIRETLDSFVAQETSYPVEFIIADDASTDSTPLIIKEYADKHPELFRPILRKENLGAVQNFFDALSKAGGEYIALCEGDDFWLDPEKIQQQVDFLDAHSDHALCFHPTKVFFQDKSVPDSVFPDVETPREFTVERLVRANFIQTNSVMYRRQSYKNISLEAFPTDWYLHLFHAQFGKIGFIDRVMAAYRRHPGGLWWDSHANLDQIWRKHGLGHLALYSEVLKMYPSNSEIQELIHEKVSELLNRLFALDFKGLYLPAAMKHPDFLLAHVRSLENQLDDRSKQLEANEQELEEIKRALSAAREEITAAAGAIQERDQHLHSILNSRSWKLLSKIRRATNRLRGR